MNTTTSAWLHFKRKARSECPEQSSISINKLLANSKVSRDLCSFHVGTIHIGDHATQRMIVTDYRTIHSHQPAPTASLNSCRQSQGYSEASTLKRCALSLPMSGWLTASLGTIYLVKICFHALYHHHFMEPPRRSGRVLRPHIKAAHSLADEERAGELDVIIKRRKKSVNPLAPILIERDPSPDIVAITAVPQPGIYAPLFHVEYEVAQRTYSRQSPLRSFIAFFDVSNIEYIVVHTNAHAAYHRQNGPSPHGRYWPDLTEGELLRFFGLLFLMGRHRSVDRRTFWQEDGHRLGRFMGLQRFEQINHYLTLRHEHLSPPTENAAWYWRREPVDIVNTGELSTSNAAK